MAAPDRGPEWTEYAISMPYDNARPVGCPDCRQYVSRQSCQHRRLDHTRRSEALYLMAGQSYVPIAIRQLAMPLLFHRSTSAFLDSNQIRRLLSYIRF